PLAQLLEAAVAGGRLGRAALERFEARADRRRIDLAHEPADVLQLAAARLVAGAALRESLCLQHGLAQLLVELEAADPRLRQLDERGAQRLALVHLLLAAGLADRFRRRRVTHRSYH